MQWVAFVLSVKRHSNAVQCDERYPWHEIKLAV